MYEYKFVTPKTCFKSIKSSILINFTKLDLERSKSSLTYYYSLKTEKR